MVDDDRQDPREDRVAETPTEHDSVTVDAPAWSGAFAPGAEIGGRYRIVSRIGAGGMGEVWRAFDLKLRVEVALKALRGDVVGSERHLEALRQEVRAAREVVSPNVCRIYDLEEIEGLELVSMEYVDGQTLLEVLRERGPLELKEAQDIASQFLAGLEAIHAAGFIHRDIKPENIMVTRAGRVVVMDFGLARHETDPSRSASGTPAYMAPEQVQGERLDARADVYAAGVVLAEMVSPGGVKDLDSRKSLWEGVRSEPPQLPDSPWAPVIRKAVLKDREQRYHTAHTLTRALEEVTLRVAGAEDLTPYPGLASFTEADAEYFFGREAEVEQMWRLLDGPPRLLGIMGPSGAGKTSFIRAGVTPNAQPDWSIIRCTPGSAAVASLRGALTSELPSGSDALRRLVTEPEDPDVIVGAVSCWSEDHSGAAIFVDQFEELFTLNSVEVQRRYAALLGRLPLEANVHVVLSMRDDFAAFCNRHEALRPVFRELTVLDPPIGANLRRALVQPATTCGYRFEDDELIDEIMGEVEGERGALPLLAFALARLWQKRDRETGLLTRQAYRDIGGVGGALARHAEATVDRIGTDRVPIVRELFRNLVTAEGTRAVREWDELLSVFEAVERKAAEEVLREMIDARLLTSYEVQEEDREPARRIEIIHESLLANWPRLVRWQTQDQEGAQLRDELRQAARSWDEHGRHNDRLWTGTAYREFRLWQERYPGGLTEVEEAFSVSMASLAGRRRRRRQIAAAAALVVFASVAAVFAGLWRRSVLQEHRAEAANLVSLGQLELASYPSATVAYAIASLELADGRGAREMAQQALWMGPTAFVVNDESSWQAEFTPDGRSLVQAGDGTGHLRVIRADGTSRLLEHRHQSTRISVEMALRSDVFFSFGFFGKPSLPFLGLWFAADGRLLGKAGYEGPVEFLGGAVSDSRHRLVYLVIEGDRFHLDTISFDGEHERLGTLSTPVKDESGRWTGGVWLDQRAGECIAVSHGNEIHVVEIGDRELGPPRLLGRHETRVTSALFDVLGRFLATADRDGQIRLWDLTDGSLPMILQGPDTGFDLQETADGSLLIATKVVDKRLESWPWSLDTDPPQAIRPFVLGQSGIGWVMFDGPGRRAIQSGPDDKIRVWPMAAPADADPLVLQRGQVSVPWHWSSHPNGQWLASADQAGAALWPFTRVYPSVIRRHEKRVTGVEFGPEGRWLVSSSMDHTVRLWPLDGAVTLPGRILLEDPGKQLYNVARTSDGQQLLIATGWSGVRSVSIEGEELHNVPEFGPSAYGLTISRGGRLAAAVADVASPEIRIVVWDIASGTVLTELRPEGRMTLRTQFTDDNHLLSSSERGLTRWDLETGDGELLFEGPIGDFSASGGGGFVFLVEETVMDANAAKRLVRLDLATGSLTPLGTHGSRINTVVLDPEGTVVVTGDLEGVVRVGPISGEEPHLLFGHENRVNVVSLDPLGRWVASGGDDGSIRLWPMPDLSKPPLHTLPREELIAKLKTLTNLRVVRDEESATGWKLTHDPFPGWETVPTW